MDLLLYHKDNSENISGLSNIKIASGSVYVSSKKITKGKWYYEYTHNSGTSNYDTIGFTTSESDASYFTYYKMNLAVHYTTFFVNSKCWNDNMKTVTTLNTDEITTIGLMLDADNNVFYIRSGNDISVFPYTYERVGDPWTVLIRHASGTASGTYSVISVNFGQNPFTYQIPTGFTAWMSSLPTEKICENNFSSRILTTFFINILL